MAVQRHNSTAPPRPPARQLSVEVEQLYQAKGSQILLKCRFGERTLAWVGVTGRAAPL